MDIVSAIDEIVPVGVKWLRVGAEKRRWDELRIEEMRVWD